MAKPGRNEPCPCGSGKKYKKCCEPKEAASKRLSAHKIESEDLTRKASSVSGLFQRLSFLPPTRLPETPEESLPKEESREDLEPPTQEPTEKS